MVLRENHLEYGGLVARMIPFGFMEANSDCPPPAHPVPLPQLLLEILYAYHQGLSGGRMKKRFFTSLLASQGRTQPPRSFVRYFFWKDGGTIAGIILHEALALVSSCNSLPNEALRLKIPWSWSIEGEIVSA